MGVIALALVAHGDISANAFYVPDWVVIASASAIALGTFVGGWRIIKTLGTRIIEMDVAQGFAAQAAGATVILAASSAGYPLSTTHVISGSIMGSGAAKRLSAVRWGVAGNIVGAWTLTLPAAAVMGAVVYAISTLFGHGAIGPLIISARSAPDARSGLHPPPPTIHPGPSRAMIAAAINTHALVKMAYSSVVGRRRRRRHLLPRDPGRGPLRRNAPRAPHHAAMAYTALAAAGLLLAAAIVIYGLTLVAHKT